VKDRARTSRNDVWMLWCTHYSMLFRQDIQRRTLTKNDTESSNSYTNTRKVTALCYHTLLPSVNQNLLEPSSEPREGGASTVLVGPVRVILTQRDATEGGALWIAQDFSRNGAHVKSRLIQTIVVHCYREVSARRCRGDPFAAIQISLRLFLWM